MKAILTGLILIEAALIGYGLALSLTPSASSRTRVVVTSADGRTHRVTETPWTPIESKVWEEAQREARPSRVTARLAIGSLLAINTVGIFHVVRRLRAKA